MTAATQTRQRVLVVDDEENVSHLVSSALSFDGFDTATSADGLDALHAATELRPDLIVLDMMMSGLDGLQVLQRLRAAGCQIPVIFLSARDTTADRLGGLRAGAADYVVKPFGVADLLKRVHTVLDAARTPASDQRPSEP